MRFVNLYFCVGKFSCETVCLVMSVCQVYGGMHGLHMQHRVPSYSMLQYAVP